MRYKVRDGLAFCITGGRTIFLDVAADRYFGLRPEWDAAFRRYLEAQEDGAGIEPLLRGHILVTADEGEPSPEWQDFVVHSCSAQGDAGPAVPPL